MHSHKPYSRKRRRRALAKQQAATPSRRGFKFSELNTRFYRPDPLQDAGEMRRLQAMADRAYAAYLSASADHEADQEAQDPPPGLLDQLRAAEHARWRHQQALRLMRRRRRELRREGTSAWLLAVTLKQGKWIVDEDDLTREFVKKLVKQVQRGARGLPPGSELSGVVDLSFNVDPELGLRAWAFHFHGTMLVIASSHRAAVARVKKAFPYRVDLAKGVKRPRVSAHVTDHDGWEDYQDKPFRFDGVKQRRARPPTADGEAQEADKRELTRVQQATLAGLYAQLSPDDLTVWFRHRRYADRLDRIECHRSESDVTDRDRKKQKVTWTNVRSRLHGAPQGSYAYFLI